MTKQKFIEDLMERLENISSELEHLRDVSMVEFEEDEDEGLTQLESELDELNEEINRSIYRSPEFYALQEKIAEKQSEIDNYEKEEVDNYTLERIIDKLNEFGFQAFDTQYDLYKDLQDEL